MNRWGGEARSWLFASPLSLSLGNRMALCKDSHQELKDPARRAENYLLRRGPGGFLDIGGPKPNQIPSARLL